MKLSDVFIAREAIFNKNNTIIAYRLILRCTSGNCKSTNNNQEIIALSTNTLNYLKLDTLEKNIDSFINVDESMLMHNFIELLPKDKCFIELDNMIVIKDDIIERIKYLNEKGFTLSLKNFELSDKDFNTFSVILPHISILNIDIMSLPEDNEDKNEQTENVKKLEKIKSNFKFLFTLNKIKNYI
jgi:c-di-GMP-related signal transduction protein